MSAGPCRTQGMLNIGELATRPCNLVADVLGPPGYSRHAALSSDGRANRLKGFENFGLRARRRGICIMELVGGEFCFQFRGLVLSNSAGPSDRGRPAEQSPPQASAGQLHHTSLFRSQQISSLVWSIRTLRKLLKGVLQFMFTLLCHRHLLVHHAGFAP